MQQTPKQTHNLFIMFKQFVIYQNKQRIYQTAIHLLYTKIYIYTYMLIQQVPYTKSKTKYILVNCFFFMYNINH